MRASGILLALLVVISISISSDAAVKGLKKVLGKWEFSAPNAPRPYDSGTLVLKEVERKLTGEFNVKGEIIAIPKVEFEAETLSLNFEIENTPITLNLKLTDGLFEGVTDTPNGLVTVKAFRSKNKSKK
jgi:hypothetical protein